MIVEKIRIAHLISSRLESPFGGDLVILNLFKYLDKNKFVSWLVSFKKVRKSGLPLIVGTADRLSKEKGYKYLLAAIKDILSVVLLIAGGGPLQKKLIEMTNKLKIKKRVIFTGFRHDVHDFIAAMDIFVLPSLSESLPLAVVTKRLFSIKKGGLTKWINSKGLFAGR